MTSDESFHKEEHLLKTASFKKVYNYGLSCRHKNFSVYYLPNNLKYSRIGFAVSSRTVKLATRRNRIKRLLRELYRKNKKELKINIDLVIGVKKSFYKDVSYHIVETVFMEALKKSGIVK